MSIADTLTRNADEFARVTMAELLADLQRTAPCGPPDIAVALVPLLTPSNPADVFTRYSGVSYKYEQHGANGFVVHHVAKTVRPAGGEARVADGHFASFSRADCWMLAMGKDDVLEGRHFTDVLQHCVLGWTEVFYPALSILSPTSSDLQGHLAGLQQEGGAVRVIRSTMRYPERGHQATQHPEQLEDTFERVEDEGGFLQKVTYEYGSQDGTYVGSASREGVAHFHSGDLQLFLTHMVGLQRRALDAQVAVPLGDRNLSPRAFAAVELDFGSRPLLGDLLGAERLVEVIDEDPALAVTVLHGNPYLHAVVADLQEGSTFTLLSRSTTQVRILPGPGAGKVSLNRLMAKIRQGFAEARWAGVEIRM